MCLVHVVVLWAAAVGERSTAPSSTHGQEPQFGKGEQVGSVSHTDPGPASCGPTELQSPADFTSKFWKLWVGIDTNRGELKASRLVKATVDIIYQPNRQVWVLSKN